MQLQYFLGFDGGGTRTRAVVVQFESSTKINEDNNIRVLGRGEAGSSNHYSAGLNAAIENIRLAARDAVQQSSLQFHQIVGWGLGLAGACTSLEQKMLREHIAPLAQGIPIFVDEDVAAAHAGAFATFSNSAIDNNLQGSIQNNVVQIRSGVICIAGTGANSFGIGDEGQRARADGLGPLLGDRGSGYRIGEAALRALCSADDGSGPPTSLQYRVLDSLQVASIDDLVPLVYNPNFTKDQIAALFPVVLSCAQDGDAVASSLLHQAGCELAATCHSVLQQCKTSRVALSGGLISHYTPVRASLELKLRRHHASLEIIDPVYEADIGAALLAYHYVNI